MNLKVFFKNVGQGDTIFVHWDNDTKFGMIDCNLVGGGITGITKHIKLFNIVCFDFVVLSHPHSDHFSGFPDFFEYCKLNDIVINRFYHTAPYHPKRLSTLFGREIVDNEHYSLATSSVNRRKHKSMLWQIYSLLHEQIGCRPNGFIKSVQVIASETSIFLGEHFTLKFLSPSQVDEHDKYIRDNFTLNSESTNISISMSENNPEANLLSSFIQIKTSDGSHQILLCSDTTSYTLNRIMNKNYDFEDLHQPNLAAMQVPHHGSRKNHVEEFWKNFSGLVNCYAIVSAGDGYGHPDLNVVNFFSQQSKEFHCTNLVGGYKSYYEKIESNENLFDLSLDIMTMFNPKMSTGMESNSIRCCEKIVTLQKATEGWEIKVINQDVNYS